MASIEPGMSSLKFAKREGRDGIECMDQHRPAPTPAPIPTTPPPPVDLNPAHDYERFALPTPRPTLSPVRPFSIRRDYILKYSTAAVYPHQSTLSRAESGSEKFGMHILHWSLVLDLRLTKAGDMLFV